MRLLKKERKGESTRMTESERGGGGSFDGFPIRLTKADSWWMEGSMGLSQTQSVRAIPTTAITGSLTSRLHARKRRAVGRLAHTLAVTLSTCIR